ncbi:MAG TPA: nitroreductase family deazaflavin-dependent oxidoreductase [Acidimicrobiales bacterium]|jgi:deazaflavin-dependent oxidoreductase (nitroreductase family)
MNDFNLHIIEEFRKNNGVVSGPFEGTPVVLLTTKGAKTGLSRTTPLVGQVADDGTLFVFGSKGGAPTNPDWYYNLVANPRVGVEFGAQTYDAKAEVVTGPYRDEVFARQTEQFPDFGDYEKTAKRVIPVIALRRAPVG